MRTLGSFRSACARAGLLLVGMLLASCAITRTETDYYTITIRDTTYREAVRNVPGSREDNGVVFPSSRVTNISRNTVSYDSTHERRYPNFLRAGGIEFAGLIGSSSTNGMGPGLFGLYSLLDSSSFLNPGSFTRPTDSLHPQNPEPHTFKGLLVRLAPVEYQLHWFEEAPNWTVGWSAFELLAQNEQRQHWLYSLGANGYIRKRFFLRDRIPYIIASPFFGGSLFPSLYANFGGELQFGSFGGYNLRMYLGYASGFTWGLQGKNSPTASASFPYFGIGVSALDFTNKVEETQREWKEYVHSAIEVNAFNFDILDAFHGYTNVFDTAFVNLPITGFAFRLADAHFPIPILDGHLWAGTSLLGFFSLGFGQSAFSVLPLRVGYRQYLIAEDLSIEPFLEYNYYPSSYSNIGARLRLDTFSGFTVGLLLGYASGSNGAFLPRILFSKTSDAPGGFSSAYAGISFGISDHLFKPEVVKALRESEH